MGTKPDPTTASEPYSFASSEEDSESERPTLGGGKSKVSSRDGFHDWVLYRRLVARGRRSH
eukprot:10977386-Lingulodinium_polyedra.AAC.1